MSVIVTRGVVLRYANYRETSRILTLFSRDLGRVTVSAKGCLRPKCRERAATEMLTLGEYTLSERAGRYYLNAAGIENAFYNLRLDLDRLACASYFADLVRCTLNDGDPQPELFDLLTAALQALCNAALPVGVVRAVFEAKAMDTLGFRPELDACAACGASLGDKLALSAEAGGTVCENCRADHPDAKPLLGGAAAFLRQAADWDMERLAVLKPSEYILNNLEQAFRPFVQWHLERTCKLDDFMDKLKEPVIPLP